MYNFVQLI